MATQYWKRWLGQIVLFALVLGGAALAHSFMTTDQIQSTGLVIVFLALALVYNDLREKIGTGALISEKEHDALSFDGRPIIPKHKRPEGIPESGFDVSPEVHLLFSDFARFADRLNKSWEEDSRWRVQEGEKSRFLIGDHIAYGRVYDVFCNHRKMGSLGITDGYEYSSGNPNVTVHARLADARLIDADGIMDFFDVVSRWICSTREQILENRNLVHQAMLHTMWEVGPSVNLAQHLEVTLSGTAMTDKQWLEWMSQWAHGARHL